MTKHYAYQHRPLSSILAPEAGQQRPASQTPDRDEKGRFVAEQTNAEETDSTLPEKYRGKTAEEIAEMHINAEKRLGQIQNELGSMRGLVSDLAQVQRPAESQTEVTETIDVSGDDLINNPVETIRKVVQQDLNAVKQAQEAQLAEKRIEQETQALLSEYGDVETITSSPEFQEFATRTPSRQADLNTAAQGEGLDQVAAARRLLENWKDFQQSLAPQTENTAPTPVEQARAVANEGPGASGKVVAKDAVYEADVIALIQSDPAKYRSPSFQAELMAAIKEGRFVKQ
jgi:hypothetical protein